ncbi:MAG: spore germination protein [Firmicutes bacterium]|nr:spore germination protein [Bacillota bacterium]
MNDFIVKILQKIAEFFTADPVDNRELSEEYEPGNKNNVNKNTRLENYYIQLTAMLRRARRLTLLMEKALLVVRSNRSSDLLDELRQEYEIFKNNFQELSPVILAYESGVGKGVCLSDASLDKKIQAILENVGAESTVKTKKFFIGRERNLDAAIIFVNNLADKKIINRVILEPLMLQVAESIKPSINIAEYLSQRYIVSSSSYITKDFGTAVTAVKNGNTVLMLAEVAEYVIVDTVGATTRQITEPPNETVVRGAKEGFIENLDINISLIRRLIKDRNLAVENFIVGKRSQTRLVLVYIKDIVNDDILNELRGRINSINVDFVLAVSMIFQLIEKKYTPFPLAFYSEKPNRVTANLLEGKVGIILDGSPTVYTVPTLIWEFFNTIEDYYDNSVIASIIRSFRIFAAIVVMFIPGIYLTLLKFNCEIIPVDFIMPIVQSRSGIPLPPFVELFLPMVLIEFLREGGLRMPTKLAQTLSIVGGIIIGDTAIQARIVSPTTLLIIGVTTIASFMIPAYEMAITIRYISFFVLFLADYMGLLGLSISLIILLIHLFSLETFGVPYFAVNKRDFKDIIIRAPLREIKNRPESMNTEDAIRQE